MEPDINIRSKEDKIKLLIINQHASNRGDESALRGFLSQLDFSRYEVFILYNTTSATGLFNLDQKIKKSVLSIQITRYEKAILILSFFLPRFILKIFPLKTKKEIELIRESDLVVNAPGGANLGIYKDWLYLWRLCIAKKFNKKVAIYSVSFGPFPPTTLYSYLAKRILNKIDFISLRDATSFRYADALKLNYTKSIDTAFLSSPGKDLANFSLLDVGIPFKKRDFIVFVPNELNRWHPYFRIISGEKIEKFYCLILNFILKSDTNVVFLPQLFGPGNDRNYFEKLKQRVDVKFHNQIIIIDDHHNSDIQQKIISQSKGAVGARYHSIVFSINNEIPFLCLSYEHKMENMLEILGLQEYSIQLKTLFSENNFERYMDKIYEIIKSILNSNFRSINSRVPQKIAKDCFVEFTKTFLQDENLKI